MSNRAAANATPVSQITTAADTDAGAAEGPAGDELRERPADTRAAVPGASSPCGERRPSAGESIGAGTLTVHAGRVRLRGATSAAPKRETTSTRWRRAAERL